jgi:hypothetical protein
MRPLLGIAVQGRLSLPATEEAIPSRTRRGRIPYPGTGRPNSGHRRCRGGAADHRSDSSLGDGSVRTAWLFGLPSGPVWASPVEATASG